MTTTRTATGGKLEASRGVGFGATISSELIKLSSSPTQRALQLTAIAMAALMAAVFYLSLPGFQVADRARPWGTEGNRHRRDRHRLGTGPTS